METLNNGSNLGPCDGVDYFQCHLAVLLWKIFCPILLTIGIAGNCISLAVWSRKRMRSSTSSLYLRILAAVDSIVLIVAPLSELIYYTTNIDIQVINNFSCRFHTWISGSAILVSTWILAALSVDRLVLIKFPMWAKKHCSKKATIYTVLSMTVLVSLISSHMLIYLERVPVYTEQTNTNATVLLHVSCLPYSDKYFLLWHTVWPVIILILYSVAPTVCLITCNIILLRLLLKRNIVWAINMNIVSQQNMIAQNTMKRRDRKPLTKILVIVCLVFLVCTLPVSVFLIVDSNLFDESKPKDLATRRLAWVAVALILYFNNACNFIIYCLSGSVFREEMVNLFRDIREAVDRKFNITVTSSSSQQVVSSSGIVCIKLR